MSDLARLSVLSPAGATRAIDTLADRALVYRRADPTDKRRVVVFLSAHGAATVAPALEEKAPGHIAACHYAIKEAVAA